jgi:hypothetical protein
LSSRRVEVVQLHVHVVVRLARPSCGDGSASPSRAFYGPQLHGFTAPLRCAVSIACGSRWRLGLVERVDVR